MVCVCNEFEQEEHGSTCSRDIPLCLYSHAHSCLFLCTCVFNPLIFCYKSNPQPSLFLSFSQDSLGTGSTQEENLGMDLDSEAVIDAENNINTARWALIIV